MSMGDIKDIFGISAGLSTPILVYIAWLMYRLYSNHLPHINSSLSDLKVDVAYLKGCEDGRKGRDTTRGFGQI